ncbi:MAG: helix-turn-helix domain-containing protein [Nanoarchaeota archaeon]|nr:helix-turn-helix domain-containing protein [Nanoarchaeota archaeon]
MKKLSSGRPIDLSRININEINEWLNSYNSVRGIIRCQAIISLHNGNSMQSVCTVLDVTRETIRTWKEKLRKGGITALLKEKKLGKRSKINIEKQKKLKVIIKQRPAKYGYDEKRWTGKILKDFMLKNWNINIGIRAAQLWLRQMK